VHQVKCNSSYQFVGESLTTEYRPRHTSLLAYCNFCSAGDFEAEWKIKFAEVEKNDFSLDDDIPDCIFGSLSINM